MDSCREEIGLKIKIGVVGDVNIKRESNLGVGFRRCFLR